MRVQSACAKHSTSIVYAFRRHASTRAGTNNSGSDVRQRFLHRSLCYSVSIHGMLMTPWPLEAARWTQNFIEISVTVYTGLSSFPVNVHLESTRAVGEDESGDRYDSQLIQLLHSSHFVHNAEAGKICDSRWSVYTRVQL